MKPNKSYIIWFRQRTGSTLLCKYLEESKVADHPSEWFGEYYNNHDLFTLHNCNSIEDLQKSFWEIGTTPTNAVLGIKIPFIDNHLKRTINNLKQKIKDKRITKESDIWNLLFPNCTHIFMTRRNKVRLAVSWWKAIQTNEWYRKYNKMDNKNIKEEDIENKYNFEAIKHLLLEVTLSEAGIQEYFNRNSITPHTIFYEDFIKDISNTIKKILTMLSIKHTKIKIGKPYYKKLSDEISEKWCKRFTKKIQNNWNNKGWDI